MKTSLPSLYSSCLPKITSQHLEQMIKSKKKPEIISTDLRCNSYKNYDKLPLERNLRLTDAVNRSTNNQRSHQYISQHLDIKSPFYKRISVKHVGKWKCNCHQNKENNAFPKLRQTHCSHHDQIIAHKRYLMKQFHDTIVLAIKQNHTKNHEAIEKNKSEYLHYSHENSAKIKEEKVKLTEKNKQENENKIAKTKIQTQTQKQLTMILLKERLDQMYNLDNQNQPFEKVLLKRNRWQTKRNVWKEKILTYIHKKFNKAKQIQQKWQKMSQSKLNSQEGAKSSLVKSLNSTITKMSQTRIQFAEQENQKLLQDIESCLGVLMKNVSSISDLVPKYQSKEIKARISEIFKKNLNIEAPHYAKKLRKMMGEIIEDIVAEETEAKLAKDKKQTDKIDKKETCQEITQNDGEETYQKSQKSHRSHKSHNNTKTKLMSNKSLKSLNCIASSVTNLEQKLQIKEKEQTNQKSALEMKAEQILLSTSLLSTSYLAPINEEYTINLAEKTFQENKKFSISSGKSSSSQRKHSGLSKLPFISNCLTRSSILSSKRKHTSGNDSSREKSQAQISPGKKQQTQELNHLNLTKNSSSTTYNYHNITPSLSKQVICEKDQLDMDSDDEENQRTARALKYYKSAREREEQMEKNRIDGMVNLLKQKIMNKKEGVKESVIPEEYLKIKYEEFCSQKTFKYMVSMVKNFSGIKRFKFIYNQLRAKKNILNDSYVQNLIKQFKPMIGDDKDLEQWKKFIFDSRTKIMFDSLNRMIDTEMQVMEPKVEELQVKEEKPVDNQQGNEEEVPKECMIFKRIDESQIAFERYLQRLLRKNQKESEPKRLDTVINLGILQPSKQQKQQSPKVSQKTIHLQIQTNSTKEIRYQVIDHSQSHKNTSKHMFGGEEHLMVDEAGLKYKKKVLGYLLRKNPLQFQQLNRNLSEVSRLFSSSRVGEGSEGRDDCLGLEVGKDGCV